MRGTCKVLVLSPARPTVEEVQALNQTDGLGRVLALASSAGMAPAEARKLLKHLIAKGVSVDAIDLRMPNKPTALYGAAVLGDVNGVQLLLDSGADRTIRSAYGETPLEAARRVGAKYPEAAAQYRAVIRLLE